MVQTSRTCDLDNLQKDLLALAASVEEAIYKAIRALQGAATFPGRGSQRRGQRH